MIRRSGSGAWPMSSAPRRRLIMRAPQPRLHLEDNAMAQPKVYPCLWFDGQAEEAASFYVSLGLPDSHVDNVWSTPADTPSGPAGSVLVVDFTIAGQRIQGLNGGPEFKF